MTDDELTILLCTILGEMPTWTWRPNVPYTRDETGIFYGAIPDKPDRAIGVRIYMATDRNNLSERRAQLRFRGPKNAPNGADNLASLAFAAMDGLSRVGGISGMRRESMAPLGADSNGREERTDNYIITLDNPEALS